MVANYHLLFQACASRINKKKDQEQQHLQIQPPCVEKGFVSKHNLLGNFPRVHLTMLKIFPLKIIISKKFRLNILEY